MIAITDSEIEALRIGGAKLAKILRIVSSQCVVGATGTELDALARALMKQEGGKPSFLNYRPSSASRPFPAALCVSLNDTIVHGVPRQNRQFRPGDLVTIDGGFVWQGFYTDAAVTVVLGKTTRETRRLVSVTKEALARAIKACRAGNTVGDIGHAVSSFVYAQDFSIPEELGGHGVGRAVHEEPFVSNIGRKREGTRLEPGMVLALEPMVCMGSGEVLQKPDGSFVTFDGSLSAHFEHTVVVTDGKPIVVTKE